MSDKMTFPSSEFREFHIQHPERVVLRQELIYDPIVQWVSRCHPHHLLDLGCGSGELTVQLGPHCKRITAIDPSQDAIEAANRWLPDNTKFFAGDVSVLAEGTKFDHVVCSMVLNSVKSASELIGSLTKYLSRSSRQIWAFLHPAYSFNGSVVLIPHSQGGFACTARISETSSYFSENCYSKILGSCLMIEHHRPLSAIVSIFVQNGYVIADIKEPVPRTRGTACQDIATLIPKVMIIETYFAGLAEHANEWIGVDLDGTLATFDHWRGADHIGEPIWPMIRKVQSWLKEGIDVRIFTSRASDPVSVLAIRDWCAVHIGQYLDVTNIKDYKMVELWDDHAVHVPTNMGLGTT